MNGIPQEIIDEERHINEEPYSYEDLGDPHGCLVFIFIFILTIGSIVILC